MPTLIGQADQPQWRKQAVVSSFILKFPDEAGNKEIPQVALFRRSDKVRTYRHRLAPISGSISNADPSPLYAAWREIREETTLTPASLALFRQGKEFSFRDPSVNREWTIYPFAFRLKSKAEGGLGEDGIQTDWEHEAWGWYDPDTVVDEDSFGGVPRLKESLRRVWFESDLGRNAERVLAAGLERLRHDHQSGSRELTAIALGVFRDVVVAMGTGAMNSGWWDRIRMVAWHLWKNGRESMGSPILNAMIAALNRIEFITFDRDVTADRLDHVLAAIDCVIEGRKSTTASIREVFTSYLHNQFLSKGDPNSPITILTLSASSTIRECIIHAAVTLDALGLDIRLLESRPLYEGVSFASMLLSQFQSRLKTPPVKITLYPDAAAALASSGVDVLLLGADRIAASGAVSNKTGSLPASLSVRHISPAAKVVVLSELEKVAEPGQTGLHVVEENDITEIVDGWREKVRGLEIIQGALQGRGSTENPGLSLEVKNIYFEWVPPELVDAYVCENGVHAVSEIQERSHWVGQQAERLFGGL